MVKLFNKIISTSRNYFSAPINGKKFIPGIAWFFLLLILLCLPGEDLPLIPGWMNFIQVDKLAHIFFFAVLIILFLAPVLCSEKSKGKKQGYQVIILIATILWGFVSEFIQEQFAEGRFFDIYDFTADTIGAVTGYFFAQHFY